MSAGNRAIWIDKECELADTSLFGAGRGLISDRRLHPLRNKKVRVTVEVIE